MHLLLIISAKVGGYIFLSCVTFVSLCDLHYSKCFFERLVFGTRQLIIFAVRE